MAFGNVREKLREIAEGVTERCRLSYEVFIADLLELFVDRDQRLLQEITKHWTKEIGRIE